MVLSDKHIKQYLKEGKIKISPKPDLTIQLGSVSIDLRLGDTFRIFQHSRFPYFDLRKKNYSGEVTSVVKVAKDEPFILQPADFILATTIENLELPDDLLARLEGRSSLGRLGIVVHSTASVFEPGWRGKVVMEMGNLGRMPVALYPGMRICALTFETLSSKVDVPYHKKKSAKYIDQSTPIPSKLADDK